MTFLTEQEAGAERGKFSDKYKSKRQSEHSVTNPEDTRPGVLTDDVEVKPFRGGKSKELVKTALYSLTIRIYHIDW